MKNKVTILIIASIATLIALSAIQGYLIENAYQLKKKSFIQETDDAISDIDNHPELDSIVDVIGEDLRTNLGDYKNNRISKAEVIRKLRIKGDSVNQSYMERYTKELNAINLGYKIRYKRQLTSIIVYNGQEYDTIFPSAKKQSLTILGENFEDENSHVVKSARTFTEFDFITQERDSVFTTTLDVELKTKDVILIMDWKSIVFRRMASLLIISVLLLLFVVGLLYYSIKNLINQKKITEIKTDFINNITHELKTPLATLSVASKSLKNTEIRNSTEAFDNTLNIVDRQNTRLQKLIDQVLTNSLSAKDIILSKDAVVDNDYFNDLIADFKLSTQQRELSIINKVCPEEVLLRIDTFHFTTALLNILENAVKYGNDQTEITIETSLKSNEYYITISDNGQGIAAQDQSQIFDKFYRVSHGNVHDVKGLGLGLYYTSQIVNAHQGKITVQSELKEGTTFIITIPIN
ncbi:HAMP domain-containing histidine kinase [Kordia sp. YSTF-M3]|uniref:histidine kinase n=1 Tax=Kordia aestuariivivens TaxID=2759037 RepID=A0ABR7Q729_9FLAO|nr:HAMP domain-containing sensor histidine kinase [Kordia aestuariivivens]MBC8754374.1 HAMP domain-containing histidine kinase [Kordia aestuariivivens]